MEYRPYGKSDKLSVIGFGGIVVMNATPEEAASYVAEAVDAGITYFDVAPSYGNAEERLGPALEPHRDKVFLACKTGKRLKDEAALELRQSLAKLKTDHVDLYQLHGLTSDADIDQAFGPDGAMEELIEAKQLGLVRHLGFSAHSEKAALEALAQYEFDSVLFPVNYFAWEHGHFGPQIMAAAEKQGAARLALKAMALGRIEQGENKTWNKAWYRPIDDPALAAISIRWTLNQPVTAAVSPGHIELLRIAIKSVSDLSAPAPAELERLAGALHERQPVFPN